jgi:predicted Zn finger-like uncharacterized protein
MEVRCEKCRTEYQFDDDKVTEAGVAVQCTQCNHVFKVKKKALVITMPVKPDERVEMSLGGGAGGGGGSSPPAAVAAAPATSDADKNREWRVRQANGNVFSCKELTTLQKWIVERKVIRDDEISLRGEQWKRLGNIPELASFFMVVDAAERVQAAHPGLAPGTSQAYPLPAQMPQQSWVGPPPNVHIYTGPAGPGPGPGMAPPGPPMSPRSSGTWTGGPVVREGKEPAWAEGARHDELTPTEISSRSKGGGRTVLLFLLLLVVGGVGYLYKTRPELLGLSPHEKPAPPPPPPAPVAQPPPPPPEPTPPPPPPPEEKKVEEPPVVPKPPTVKSLLAQAAQARDRGWVEKALDIYGKVLQMDEENVAALAGRGWCYLDLSQYAPAQSSFEAALEIEPTEGDAVMGLAETYRYQSRNADAIRYYRKYLELEPDGEDATAAKNALEQLKE